MSEDYVRVAPLGGLSTFGMNCTIIEHAGKMLVIDCGIAFPGATDYGLDYFVPDWSYAVQNRDRVVGIIITHAHEDHIGAIPLLLDQLDVPVITGRFSAASLRRRLGEWNFTPKAEHITVDPGDVIEIGPFELEFIHVNHSTANAMAVAVRTSLGDVLFTGDWRVDHTPIGEPVTDLPALARLGDDGVLAIIGDSTNAQVPGFSRSERVVQRALEGVIRDAPGRVIIGLFSSNMPRIRGLVEVAHRLDRRIVLMGRSLSQNVGLARETGFLRIEGHDPFIDVADMKNYDDDQIIVLATGSQAEPRSTIARLAQGDHHQISLAPDDTVVLSARMIPGNEAAIQHMFNAIVRRGARVITTDDGPVHTSGHAYREEMKLLMNLVRPQFVVPVHGEFRMRLAHGDLARELGFEVRMVEEGDVLEFTAEGAAIVERIPIGRIAVDGTLLGDVDDIQLRDRRNLAAAGIVVAFAVLDRAAGSLTSLELLQHGFLPEHEDTVTLLRGATDYAREAVEELSRDARSDAPEVGETLRAAVRRYFRREIEKKPVVIPVVHEL